MKLDRIIEFIPFVLATGTPAHLRTQRIIEAVIIAALSGGASAYVSVAVMQADLKALSAKLTRIETTIDKMQGDLYIPRTYGKDHK